MVEQHGDKKVLLEQRGKWVYCLICGVRLIGYDSASLHLKNRHSDLKGAQGNVHHK